MEIFIEWFVLMTCSSIIGYMIGYYHGWKDAKDLAKIERLRPNNIGNVLDETISKHSSLTGRCPYPMTGVKPNLDNETGISIRIVKKEARDG